MRGWRLERADDGTDMKTVGTFDVRNGRRLRQLQRLIVLASSPAIAMRYCLAAQRDEKNGFPLSAAMEWRKAAELLAPFSSMSNRCWCEWERIMRLPRRLGGAIGVCDAVQYSSPAPPSKAAVELAVVDNPLAAAA